MSFILNLIAASLTHAASAPPVLLNCNVPVGPITQVTVLNTQNGLVLKELTKGGHELQRELSAEEWNSGTLNLTHEDGRTRMVNSPHGWWVYSKEGNRNHTAPADCDKN